MNSRQKGKRGELELAQFLRGHGLTARRGVQYHGGVDSPDVVCDELAGFHFECKRVEAGSLYNWMAQAKRDAGSKVPVVAHRRNDEEWVAIVRLADLLPLLRSTP